MNTIIFVTRWPYLQEINGILLKTNNVFREQTGKLQEKYCIKRQNSVNDTKTNLNLRNLFFKAKKENN